MPTTAAAVQSHSEPQSMDASPLTVDAFLEGLDMRIVESGPAVHARKCSTDNGCDTQKTGDC